VPTSTMQVNSIWEQIDRSLGENQRVDPTWVRRKVDHQLIAHHVLAIGPSERLGTDDTPDSLNGSCLGVMQRDVGAFVYVRFPVVINPDSPKSGCHCVVLSEGEVADCLQSNLGKKVASPKLQK